MAPEPDIIVLQTLQTPSAHSEKLLIEKVQINVFPTVFNFFSIETRSRHVAQAPKVLEPQV